MVPEHWLVWDGRVCVWGYCPPPVMGDWQGSFSPFPDPETDVTCTTMLAIQLNIDVHGGWRRKVGRKRQVLANGMPHHIIIVQKPCPLQRIMGAEGNEYHTGLGTGPPCGLEPHPGSLLLCSQPEWVVAQS